MTVTTTSSNHGVASPEKDEPFLGRELRVELTDGRIVAGTLIAFEGSGDLLLSSSVEQRQFKDGFIHHRGLNLMAIPFKYVKTLHRRLPGNEPLIAQLQ